MIKTLFFLLASLVIQETLQAQQKLPAYQPSREEIIERYRKAKLLDSLATRSIFKASVQPNWQPDGNFWYRNSLKDSAPEYVYVDVAHSARKKPIDNEKLATALSGAMKRPVPARSLRINRMLFGKDAATVSLETSGSYWSCNLSDYTLTKLDSMPAGTPPGRVFPFERTPARRGGGRNRSLISPDKQWEAVIKEGNIYTRSLNTNGAADSIIFTTDGNADKPYGDLVWSPDSKYLVGYHIRPVKDSSVSYVLSSVSNTTRGQLRTRPYKQPGDAFTTYEMYLFDIGGKKTVKVNTPAIDFIFYPELHWRHNDSRYFTFQRTDRGHQRFRLTEVDAASGETKTTYDEQTKTFIYEQRIYTHYLPETDEVVMTSEKDGWRHLYLLDLVTGKEKMQITKGDWIVRNIDSVDAKKREIWFTASGMNPGEDPYYIHYYRIGFDGKSLVRLTEQKANHIVTFSPDKKCYIDAYSEINVPTITELHRTSDGKKIMDVEKADATAYLATGMRFPEPFHAKGRDGVTDIWGVIVRPADFDPGKRYPVVENIYAGPQDAFVPKDFTSRYGEMQSIAQMGFIVVQIDGMGTANRSKAFHDVCWMNIADAGFPDRILWIKALAGKYPYVDTSRVGLYGTSAGGQNSLGGLLFHGEFYKAAVSSCGCHDNRIDKQWWNEQWMGYPIGKHYDEQSNVTNAWKLRGDLLLMVGEGDNNVPPESTYRVADALIKAGKTFEFLPLPGFDHTDGGPYGRVKRRDFFVKHLLGVDPPQRNSNEL